MFYFPLSEYSYPICGSRDAISGSIGDTHSNLIERKVLEQGSLVARVLLPRTITCYSLATVALLMSLDAAAVDVGAAESLAKHSGCNKCHAVEKKKDGPALRDVAAKYRGDEHAVEKLIKHVTSGEMVKFDDGHKEEHKKVKTQDADQTRNLIDWILSLEGGTKY